MCRLRLNQLSRHALAVAYLALGVLTCHVTIAEEFPFTARVVVPAAAVLSGPGGAYYPTDTLPEGTAVEVYRQQPDGWCAIRPPEASFSWVYGGHLNRLDGSLAEVDKENVASRIGSRLSDRRNAVQVRLKKGETVQLLGEQAVEGRAWYKIAPPAGEFRWIHAGNIARSDATAAAEPAAPEILTVSSAGDDVAAGSSPDATPRQQPSETPAAADGNAELGDDWRESPATDEAIVAAEPSDRSAGDASDDSAPPPASPPSTDAAVLDRRVAHIELRLSRMVAQPPATWDIAALEQAAEQLLSEAQTAAERENVKLTLRKLDRFAAIHRRYARAGATAQAPLAPITPVAPLGPTPPPQPPAGAPTGLIPLAQQSHTPPSTAAGTAPYDAVGTLRPVVSQRPGAPQYALVNEQGQVVSFVTPTPDVNLQPYVGRRVGVVGNRGYIPEFHRAHVTAGRVTPLGEPIVR